MKVKEKANIIDVVACYRFEVRESKCLVGSPGCAIS